MAQGHSRYPQRAAQRGRERSERGKGREDRLERSGARRPAWLKAPSSTHNGACVEIASTADKVAIRDSKDPDGPTLLYTPAESKAFLNGAQNEEFDSLVH
jgi:hypothetical protein